MRGGKIMALLLLFTLILCFIADRVSSKKDGPPRRPPGLKDYCEEDIRKFCPPETEIWEFLCLVEHEDELSDQCKNYLGKTTFGGCEEDARTLCPEETEIHEVENCLEMHARELSEKCLRNINNRNDEDDPYEDAKRHREDATHAITVLSSIFISIPLILALLALRKLLFLRQEENEVLNRFNLQSFHEKVNLGPRTTVLSGETKREPWLLGFAGICFWVQQNEEWSRSTQKKKKQILCEVTGEVPASSVTAIMGPSGSGKTTLLKLLSGQMTHGEFKGLRSINGDVFLSPTYDQILRGQGYVDQQDSLLQNLTVWQTLMYAALIRLPQKLSKRQKLSRAADVMVDMALTSSRETLVGSNSGSVGDGTGIGTSAKSISGGQRRRLSIGVELLGSPQVLLLDEPTSGLDATSTLMIVRLLHQLSRNGGTTIVLSIHQPRAEVFGLFDSLLLLGVGGKMIYSGPTSEAVAHLCSASVISQRISSNVENPGDFLIDVLDLQVEEDSVEPSSVKSPLFTLGTRLKNATSIGMKIWQRNKNTTQENEKELTLVDLDSNSIFNGLNVNEKDGNSEIPLEHAIVKESGTTPFSIDPVEEELESGKPQNLVAYMDILSRHFVHSTHYQRLQSRFESQWEQYDEMKEREGLIAASKDENSLVEYMMSLMSELKETRGIVLSQWIYVSFVRVFKYIQSSFSAFIETVYGISSIFTGNSNKQTRKVRKCYTKVPQNEEISAASSNDVELSSSGLTLREENKDFSSDMRIDGGNIHEKLITDEKKPTLEEMEFFPRVDSLDPRNGSSLTEAAENSGIAGKRAFRPMPSVFGMEDERVSQRFVSEASASVVQKISQYQRQTTPAYPSSQVWILYGRRLQAFMPTGLQFLFLTTQIVIVAIVLSVTYSYDISTELELPYQVLMLLSLITLYAMNLQYLLMIPEYIAERSVIAAEQTAGLIKCWPYVFSAMMTEVPRAIFHSILLLGVVYLFHPLNPNHVYIAFSVVCLIIGLVAWQSLICVCAMFSDNAAFATTLAFLILASGTLFGGLMVRLSKIPSVFKIFYYISVPAVTQRAMVANDLSCCYLSATCNSIAEEFGTSATLDSPVSVPTSLNSTYEITSFCPPGLQMTGDGSDEGNLGRMYLLGLGLEGEHPFLSLFLLCLTIIIYRIVAVVVLKHRNQSKYKLAEISVNRKANEI